MEKLEQINLEIQSLKKKLSSKQPSPEELNEVLSSIQQSLSWDVGKPLGSATLILAGLFSTVTDPEGRFAWIHLEMTEQNQLLKGSLHQMMPCLGRI